MAYSIISRDCINCGACEPECPVEAISEQDGVRVIDEDLCTSCSACVDVCPTDCIESD